MQGTRRMGRPAKTLYEVARKDMLDFGVTESMNSNRPNRTLTLLLVDSFASKLLS